MELLFVLVSLSACGAIGVALGRHRDISPVGAFIAGLFGIFGWAFLFATPKLDDKSTRPSSSETPSDVVQVATPKQTPPPVPMASATASHSSYPQRSSIEGKEGIIVAAIVAVIFVFGLIGACEGSGEPRCPEDVVPSGGGLDVGC